MRQLRTLLLAAAAVLSTGPAHADDRTWTGNRDGTTFGNPGNWSPMNVPGAFDTAIFNINFPLVTLGGSVENERLSVLQLGNGTLNLSGCSYSLLGFGPPSIEIEGSITISDGQLLSTNEALIHPSGSLTLSDLQWDHSGELNVQGLLMLSPMFDFTSVTSSQVFLAPGSSVMILNESSWEISDVLDINGSLSMSSQSSVVSNGAVIGASGLMTMTESIWINNDFFDIDGSLELIDKSTLTSSGAQIGANSSITIDTDSIWSADDSLTMFGGGDASLTISNGASVSATVFQAGMDAGLISLTIDTGGSLFLSEELQSTSIAQHLDSNVTVIVDDGNWFNAGPLNIGAGGSASLTILNHGNVFCSEAQIASQSGSVGTVTVTGTDSPLANHTSWEITGELQVGNGGTGSLLIENSAEVDCGSGRIGDEGGLPGTVTVTGFNSGWEIKGDLDIGPGDLTISDGGSVFSHEAFVGSEDEEGEGEAGTITITGADSQWINPGLFILGIESNGSLDIADGGTMLSGSGYLGLFTGSSGMVTVDGPGSTWIDLSDLFVGDFGSGTLNITNGGSVFNTAGFVGSFAGSDGTAIVDGPGSTWTNLASLAVGNFGTGSLTVSDGGTVAAPQITVSDTGEIHGDGILAGNVTNSGVASPGLSIGTLNIQGDYLQTPSAVLDIELSASGGDRLAITGHSEHSNTTLMLSSITGDEPGVGQMFTILTAASISGQEFTVIDDGGQYEVTYSSTDIVVTVVALPPLACPADLDGNGSVGASDLLSLLVSWGPCKGCPADFDGNGSVGASDLLVLLVNWGPCP